MRHLLSATPAFFFLAFCRLFFIGRSGDANAAIITVIRVAALLRIVRVCVGIFAPRQGQCQVCTRGSRIWTNLRECCSFAVLRSEFDLIGPCSVDRVWFIDIGHSMSRCGKFWEKITFDSATCVLRTLFKYTSR